MKKRDIELFVLIWIGVIAFIAGTALGIKGLGSALGEEVVMYVVGGGSFLILTGLLATYIVWKIKGN